jgi:hypothetical protein
MHRSEWNVFLSGDIFHPTGSLWSIITASRLPAKRSVLHNCYALTFMMIINRPLDLGLYNLHTDRLCVLWASQCGLTCCLPFPSCSLYNPKFRQADCPACHLLSCWSLAWPILQPGRWKHHVPPKCWLTFNRLHDVIPQMKIKLFYFMTLSTESLQRQMVGSLLNWKGFGRTWSCTNQVTILVFA